MMSEEEVESDSFLRHRPSWRSSPLNRFLEKLENRYKSKNPNSLAKPRTYGDPVQKIAPFGTPSWMIVPEHSNGSAASSGLDLFSDVELTNSDCQTDP